MHLLTGNSTGSPQHKDVPVILPSTMRRNPKRGKRGGVDFLYETPFATLGPLSRRRSPAHPNHPRLGGRIFHVFRPSAAR